MDSFLKFLEDNCPGDDAHDGAGESNKPLLERCGMCASLYEAHQREVDLKVSEYRKALTDIADRSCCDEICIGPCSADRAKDALTSQFFGGNPGSGPICKDCGSYENWPGCVGHPCSWVNANRGAASYTRKRPGGGGLPMENGKPWEDGHGNTL